MAEKMKTEKPNVWLAAQGILFLRMSKPFTTTTSRPEHIVSEGEK
jgi:hypothetical protein